VKFQPVFFKIYRVKEAKNAFSSTLELTMTLNLDLLNPKVYAVILVPKCINAEGLVKKYPVVIKILR